MALTGQDLGVGARVKSRFVRERPWTTVYAKELAIDGRRVGRSTVTEVDQTLYFSPSVALARSYMAGLQTDLRSPARRKSFLDALRRGFAQGAGRKPAKVTFGLVRHGRVGDESIVVRVRFEFEGTGIELVSAFARVDRVVTQVDFIGMPSSALESADAVRTLRSATAKIGGHLDPLVKPPSLAGTAQEGQTISSVLPSLDDSDVTIAYRWERCDAAGASCVAITGAVASSYALSTTDVGAAVRIVLVVSSRYGRAEAPSLPTAPVTALAGPPAPPPPEL
jgi:hypothetical protein